MKDDDILKMIEDDIDAEIAAQSPSSSKKHPKSNRTKRSSRPVQNNTKPMAQDTLQSLITSSELPESTEVSESPNMVGESDLSNEIMTSMFDTEQPEEKAIVVSESDEAETGIPSQATVEDNSDLLESLKEKDFIIKTLQHDLMALKNQLEACEAERDELRVGALDSGNLQVVFQERGLIGFTEAESAIQSLAASKLLSELLPALSVVDPPRVRRLLNEHLQLVSAGVPKSLTLDQAKVLVSSDRCELAGNIDVSRAQRRFIDGLVVNGYRSISILGAPVRLISPLRALALHYNIKVSIGPAIQRLTREGLLSILAGETVVFLWNPTNQPFDQTIIPNDLLLYLQSDSHSLAGFLLDIGEQLLTHSSGEEDDAKG